MAFERTITLAPDIEQPYVFLGKMLDQIPDQAADLTRVFIAFEKAYPENWVGYVLHAKGLLVQSEDIPVAENLLRRAAALNPAAAEPHYLLGVGAQQRHRFEEAAVEFEKAAQLSPADSAAYYHLAQVYDRLGKPERAAEARARHAQLSSVVRP